MKLITKPIATFTLSRIAGAAACCFALSSSWVGAQINAPSQGLKPPTPLSSPILGAPKPVTSTAPAPTPTTPAAPLLKAGEKSATSSVKVLTKSEGDSAQSKLAAAKLLLAEQAKQKGGDAASTSAEIAKLQPASSAKVSLAKPRNGWVNLEVSRAEKINFDQDSVFFDAAIIAPNTFGGHPSCKFTAPEAGSYIIDFVIDTFSSQDITLWMVPHEAEDSRARIVSQKASGNGIHIVTSIQAGKSPALSMSHTIDLYGAGQINFKSCEITRLK